MLWLFYWAAKVLFSLDHGFLMFLRAAWREAVGIVWFSQLSTGDLWLCPSSDWRYRYWSTSYYTSSYVMFQSFQNKKPNETHKCLWEGVVVRWVTCHLPLGELPCHLPYTVMGSLLRGSPCAGCSWWQRFLNMTCCLRKLPRAITRLNVAYLLKAFVGNVAVYLKKKILVCCRYFIHFLMAFS